MQILLPGGIVRHELAGDRRGIKGEELFLAIAPATHRHRALVLLEREVEAFARGQGEQPVGNNGERATLKTRLSNLDAQGKRRAPFATKPRRLGKFRYELLVIDEAKVARVYAFRKCAHDIGDVECM